MLENTEGWSPYETYFKILGSDSANKHERVNVQSY